MPSWPLPSGARRISDGHGPTRGPAGGRARRAARLGCGRGRPPSAPAGRRRPRRWPGSPPPRPTGPPSPRPPAPASPAPSWPPSGSTSSSATSRSSGRPLGRARRRGARRHRGRDRPAVRREVRRAARPAARPRRGSTARSAAVLNVVKCRPPGNRTPKAPEVARCSGWLRRQLELLDPPVVVALGLSAAKWFLGPRTVLGQVRGRPHAHRRAGGLGDLPPLGRHPVRAERCAAGGAAGRPRPPSRGSAAREARARPADAGGHPRARPVARRRAARRRPRRPRRSAGCGQDRADPGHRRGPRRREPVTSPTFVIARVHRGGRVPLVHVDAYRLGGVADVDDLDLDASDRRVGDRRRVGAGAGRAVGRRAPGGAPGPRGTTTSGPPQLVPHGPGWEERLAA